MVALRARKGSWSAAIRLDDVILSCWYGSWVLPDRDESGERQFAKLGNGSIESV